MGGLRIGCIKCKHLLNARKTDPIHCDLDLKVLLDMIAGAGVGLCGPMCMYV